MSTTDPELPLTPYDRGTSSGHSGSEASEERSVRRDAEGLTAATQRRVLDLVRSGGNWGWTVAEVRHAIPDEHHGTISGALSNLHQKGLVARLKERRSRCQVYVVPEFVGDRETAPHGRKKSGLTDGEERWLSAVQHRINNPEGGESIYVTRSGIRKMLAIIERLS